MRASSLSASNSGLVRGTNNRMATSYWWPFCDLHLAPRHSETINYSRLVAEKPFLVSPKGRRAYPHLSGNLIVEWHSAVSHSKFLPRPRQFIEKVLSRPSRRACWL